MEKAPLGAPPLKPWVGKKELGKAFEKREKWEIAPTNLFKRKGKKPWNCPLACGIGLCPLGLLKVLLAKIAPW